MGSMDLGASGVPSTALASGELLQAVADSHECKEALPCDTGRKG